MPGEIEMIAEAALAAPGRVDLPVSGRDIIY
jgi:hypothetical protein